MTNPPIDTLNFEILHAVYTADKPLWKKRIHKSLQDDIALQTTGRRVNKLRDAGLLDQCIVSADDLKRKYIIAFDLTDEGRKKMEDGLQQLLDEKALTVHEHVADTKGSAGLSQIDIDKGISIKLLSARYNLAPDEEDFLRDEFTPDELALLLFIVQTRQHIEQEISETIRKNVGRFTEQHHSQDPDNLANIDDLSR